MNPTDDQTQDPMIPAEEEAEEAEAPAAEGEMAA